MKILNKIKENKMFFVFFGALVISSFIYLIGKDFDDIVQSYYYPLYVLNYKCGFSSRLLIGSIFSLFIEDKLSTTMVTTVLLIVYYIMCLFLSLFVNNRLKKRNNIKHIEIYLTFVVLSPVFVAFVKFLGTTDMFWIFLVIASFLVVDKKLLRWLVPVFCVLGLAVHEFFAVVYLPVIAGAVFYRFAEKPKADNLIYLIICALICGAAAFYFLVLGKGTLIMTSEEMIEYARSKIDSQGNNFSDFYLKAAFFWEGGENPLEYRKDFSGYIKYAFEIFVFPNFKELLCALVADFISASPFLYVIFKSVKIEQNPLKKFSLICLSSVPFISAFLLFMSTDISRLSEHFLINIIFVVLLLVNEKDVCFESSCNRLTDIISKNKLRFAVIGSLISIIVFSGVLFWLN